MAKNKALTIHFKLLNSLFDRGMCASRPATQAGKLLNFDPYSIIVLTASLAPYAAAESGFAFDISLCQCIYGISAYFCYSGSKCLSSFISCTGVPRVIDVLEACLSSI
jgi:hypothetical protein